MITKHKIPIFFGGFLMVALLAFSFYQPSYTGHVPASVNRQAMDLKITENQNYQLTTDSVEPFYITSLKMSGEISGDGQVKVLIDTGRGQRVLVYDNIVEKEKKGSGLASITGRAIDDIDEEVSDEERDWLIIKPIKVLLEKPIFDTLQPNQELLTGSFVDECKDTCAMRMELSDQIAYRFIFLVEEGTALEITELLYHAEE